MTIIKSKSEPTNINKIRYSEQNLKEITSFNDFKELKLAGQQKILNFGKYTQKEKSSKNNRRKIISYFYRNLRSKL